MDKVIVYDIIVVFHQQELFFFIQSNIVGAVITCSHAPKDGHHSKADPEFESFGRLAECGTR